MLTFYGPDMPPMIPAVGDLLADNAGVYHGIKVIGRYVVAGNLQVKLTLERIRPGMLPERWDYIWQIRTSRGYQNHADTVVRREWRPEGMSP
jgi:hypothetical protein